MDDQLSEEVMLDDALLDKALRTPPEPRIPANFRQRLLARLPETTAPQRRRRWFWPALGVFSLLSFIFLAETAFQLGVERWLTQPSMLLTTLGIEIVFSILLLWRARA
jgi:hypothetical protein